MRTAVVLVALIAIADPAHAQTPTSGSSDRFHSFGYARLGYGGVFADRVHGAPAIGFGFRGELESFALDISFINLIFDPERYDGLSAVAGSTVRLQALRYVSPEAERSAYVGGGLSWGGVTVSRESTFTSYITDWHGNGLQGEATVGYELPRNGPVRVFVQADIGLPLYYATSETLTFTRTPPGVFNTPTSDKRYIPSAAVTVGLGWSRR